MKIKRERLIHIIKEEMDKINGDLYSKDREESLAIFKSQDSIRELRTVIEQLKLARSSEENASNFVGHPEAGEPDLTEFDQQIKRMEAAINELEKNIQASLTNSHQMK